MRWKELKVYSRKYMINLSVQIPQAHIVPTDEAFKQLGDAKLQRLLGDKNYLTKVILFFIHKQTV